MFATNPETIDAEKKENSENKKELLKTKLISEMRHSVSALENKIKGITQKV